MKILFLVPPESRRSQARLRIQPFAQAGLRAGLDITCREIPRRWYARYCFFSRLPRVDVLVVHRQTLSCFELGMLRRLCSTLVYDVADAAWTLPAGEFRTGRGSMDQALLERRFGQMCRGVDLCLADNRLIAKKILNYQDMVRTIHTPIDVECYRPGTGGKQGGVPLVGWIGLPGEEKLLEGTMDSLAAHGGGIQFSFLSAKPYAGPGHEYAMWSNWKKEDEPSRIQAMDIGLVIHGDDEYSRAGSNVEVLRYMAAGVAVVASDTGSNAAVIDHGIDGFLVREGGDWERYVVRLARDPELRRNMTETARRKVVDGHSLEKISPRLWDALGA
ncbi:glycosyltransferase [Pseudodesulfovibrio cashew]|uniref:Glycosyltransferase n=1 Tax=Pseudodesulfovibrio cashew TaxID=2678688 RepID=A0A6I6JNK7_9BACT|nr:glycosyltransferase family 4 protein [Pseudodesulfovibrio cashew]QGY41673.1 glycosyltransferase [Pseudodesulfovibrio cashew]